MKKIALIFCLTGIFQWGCTPAGNDSGESGKRGFDNALAIQPYQQNPRYWQYQGEPVLLLGGSKNDNLFQSEDLEAHLDSMVAVGANYVRNTMSSRDEGDVWPFKPLPDGRYDLDGWNKEYWRKFEEFLKMTHERSIFVQIEVWDRFDYSREPWKENPFNPVNNINFEVGEVPLDTVYSQHPASDVQPFFHTIPGMLLYTEDLEPIRRFQEKRVDKMLSYTLQYDHIIYCMNNETSTPVEWGEHWIHFISERAKFDNKKVYATDMYDHFFKPSICDRCLELIAQPEVFAFLDISQINSRNFGQDHWDTLQWILERREQYKIRPANCTKVYGGMESTWGSGTNQDGVERFIRDIIGGTASARHHRPDHGNGLNELAKASIKSLRKLESRAKMWEMSPAMDLLDNREPNEAYLTAKRGEKYAVYFPGGGSVSLDLSDHPQQFALRWIRVQDGKWGEEEQVKGGGKISLASPDDTGWIAVLAEK